MKYKLSQTTRSLEVHPGALLVDKIVSQLPLILTTNVSRQQYRADRIPDAHITFAANIVNIVGLFSLA